MDKVRVRNFKSVVDSGDFELRPLTVLAGANSSGKSSLLQSLLLLKQSIDAGTNEIFKTVGPFVEANQPLDFARGKKRTNAIGISLTLDAEKLQYASNYGSYIGKFHDGLESAELQIEVVANGNVVLNSISCLFRYKGTEDTASIQMKRKKSGLYTIKFTSPLMVGLDKSEKLRTMDNCQLTFRAFIPLFAEWQYKEKPDTRTLVVMKELEMDLSIYLSRLVYIGPQRVKPALAVSYNQTSFPDVGVDGQQTRFLYEENKAKAVEDYGGKTLQELCKSWICEKMELANNMDVQRDGNKLYRTVITNNEGLSVDLCQMGFGLSQVLPVVVQGLLLRKGQTLIVEDPDVHMHPKVQAAMVDFFVDLVRHGRRVIVETHSDHLVTRLRRRLSENTITNMDVNLCFVENGLGGSAYHKIDMEDDGSFKERLPKGFLDVQEEDFKEIISNRVRKKLS